MGSIKKFFKNEELKRNNPIVGESNASALSVAGKMAGFMLKQRVTIASAYTEKTTDKIYNNYKTRITTGKVLRLNEGDLVNFINDLGKEIEEKRDKFFYDEVGNIRLYQRAHQYYRALISINK